VKRLALNILAAIGIAAVCVLIYSVAAAVALEIAR
jgi:hypothetical protein